jgi:hypothetical protein
MECPCFYMVERRASDTTESGGSFRCAPGASTLLLHEGHAHIALGLVVGNTLCQALLPVLNQTAAVSWPYLGVWSTSFLFDPLRVALPESIEVFPVLLVDLAQPRLVHFYFYLCQLWYTPHSEKFL